MGPSEKLIHWIKIHNAHICIKEFQPVYLHWTIERPLLIQYPWEDFSLFNNFVQIQESYLLNLEVSVAWVMKFTISTMRFIVLNYYYILSLPLLCKFIQLYLNYLTNSGTLQHMISMTILVSSFRLSLLLPGPCSGLVQTVCNDFTSVCIVHNVF